MTEARWMLVHSLEKVLPGAEPTPLVGTDPTSLANAAPAPLAAPCLTGLHGERISFQLAYGGSCAMTRQGFTVTCECDEETRVTIRRVGLVPCDYPCHGTADDRYLSTEPGLYPDVLLPYAPGEILRDVPRQWRALWIDVEAEPGEHLVTLRVLCESGEELERFPVTVRVADTELPPQRLIHTEWFHTDCLADYYRVPVFSEEHWRIIENFITTAVRHGINAILTPVFTPPLDTFLGQERTTVQLVGVRKEGEVYSFDFSRVGRWIEICERCGVEYLEISHLFSQWGALYAPKVMAVVDGEERQIFGWHTKAMGSGYTDMLRTMLPQLKEYLREKGWLSRVFFHISDEPGENELDTYRAARDSVKDILADCRVMDAISSYEIYRQGIIERPVVSEDRLEPFLADRPEHLWIYYCTAQYEKWPNRFMAMPSGRSRILGVLLYYYDLEGFLQWGFNFYNSAGSIRHIDPFRVTDAGEAFPSGDPFIVYPGPDGTAWESVRGMSVQQAMTDLRVLQLGEAKLGRARVLGLIRQQAGGEISFAEYPIEAAFFEGLREAVLKEIGEG